jgi:hypothetical protein
MYGRLRLWTFSRVSHPTLRSRQLGPVEAQFFTRTANDACVKNLVRAAQRHLRLSPLTMNRHVRMACAALLLISVEAATVLGQPFVKRRAFHRFSPVPDANSVCSCSGDPINKGVSTVANGACHQALNPVQSLTAVAQAPLTDGLAAAMMSKPKNGIRLFGLALLDRVGSLFGRQPIYIPGHGRPGDLSIGATPDGPSRPFEPRSVMYFERYLSLRSLHLRGS